MNLFILSAAALIAWAGADGFYEGEPCVHRGRAGFCKNINSCQSATREIAQRRPPKTCSFQGTVPVVCCFDEPPSVATPPPARPAQASTTEYVPPIYVDISSNGGTTADGCEPISANLTSQKTGRKAWDKCIEYQEKYVYPCERGVVLTGEKVRANHCGHNADELVVGGVDAKSMEFPHMALLIYGTGTENTDWFCGGSVISERFVLTAGHCTSTRENVEVQFVRTAMLKKSEPLDRDRVYRVANIIKHPQYNPPSKYNDIALLRTATDIILDQFVVPVCLPIGSSLNDDRASTVGFGLTKYRGSNADNLQKVILLKFTTSECSDNFPSDRNMEDGFQEKTQLCYGDKEKSKDTCQTELLVESERQKITVSLVREHYIENIGELRRHPGYKVIKRRLHEEDLSNTSVYFEGDASIDLNLDRVPYICLKLRTDKIILRGDINAWIVWWGSERNDARGVDIRDLLDLEELHILN